MVAAVAANANWNIQLWYESRCSMPLRKKKCVPQNQLPGFEPYATP